MSSKNPVQRLQDIVENVDIIASFVAGMDRDDFAADRKTVYAVVRALEIVSEASRRLGNDVKVRHSEIDWAAVAAAGNVYRHEYGRGCRSGLAHAEAQSGSAARYSGK